MLMPHKGETIKKPGWCMVLYVTHDTINLIKISVPCKYFYMICFNLG